MIKQVKLLQDAPRRHYQTAAKLCQEENSPRKRKQEVKNPKEDEEEAAKAEDKEVGCPADDEAVTGDTPGGPDVKAQKRKTRQEKKRNETKERQKVGRGR